MRKIAENNELPLSKKGKFIAENENSLSFAIWGVCVWYHVGGYHKYVTSHLSHFKKLTSHFSVILVHFFTIFSLRSSHLRAIFPMFHFFTFKNGILSLFTLVTLNMVSPLSWTINISTNLTFVFNLYSLQAAISYFSMYLFIKLSLDIII